MAVTFDLYLKDYQMIITWNLKPLFLRLKRCREHWNLNFLLFLWYTRIRIRIGFIEMKDQRKFRLIFVILSIISVKQLKKC